VVLKLEPEQTLAPIPARAQTTPDNNSGLLSFGSLIAMASTLNDRFVGPSIIARAGLLRKDEEIIITTN